MTKSFHFRKDKEAYSAGKYLCKCEVSDLLHHRQLSNSIDVYCHFSVNHSLMWKTLPVKPIKAAVICQLLFNKGGGGVRNEILYT